MPQEKVPVYIPCLQCDLLKGRTALVTGGSSGIGFAIVQAFLNSGANVIFTGLTAEEIDRTCEKLNNVCSDSADSVSGFFMDISGKDKIKAALEQILAQSGAEAIDILVNNAGILRGGSFKNMSEEAYDAVMDTNLKGAYFLSQMMADYMIEHKIKGNILNIASSSSLRPAISPYTLSKWGIRGLTLGLSKTLIPHGIVVNGLAPGPTATPMLIKDDRKNLDLPSSPAGRYIAPEEIANMAVVLTSSLGRMIVGDIIYITGGTGLITFDDIQYNF